MWGKKLFVIALFPWTMGVLPDRALADVKAVLACRTLPPGPARADCLEQASARLEREGASNGPAPAIAPPQRQAPREGFTAGSRGRIAAGVDAITYRDGRPVFRLDNGQTWYSVDRRRLSFRPGRSHVTIEKTPVGMLLHYNGSFFALQVVAAHG